MSYRSSRRETKHSSSYYSPTSSSHNSSRNVGGNNEPTTQAQSQTPVFLVNSTNLANQPQLTRLTETPVFLYQTFGSDNPNVPVYCAVPVPVQNAVPPINAPVTSVPNLNPTEEVCPVESNGKTTSKKFEESPRKIRQPWKGYIGEEEGKKKRFFQSAGLSAYYAKEAISDSDSAVHISSATDKLLRLHKKFIAHRKLMDDGRDLESRLEIHPTIPFTEPLPTEFACECEEHQQKTGIHHYIFPKEAIPRCDELTNNANIIHHYRLVITPETNFVTRDPTTIYYDGKDFCFEGYSIFTHVEIDEIPAYTFNRHFIEYTVKFIKVDYIPEGFCIKDLDIVSDYLFNDIMELTDWKQEALEKNCCRRFHFMPRFVHRTQDLTTDVTKEVSEILSMGEVMQYLLESASPFANKESVRYFRESDWQDFAKEKHGTIVTNCRNKPRSIRVDDVSHACLSQGMEHPDIVHLTPQFKDGSRLDLKEFGNLCYKLAKAKRAVKSRAIPRHEDQKLVLDLTEQIQKKRDMKGATRWEEINFTSRKYMNTGLRWDTSQHASYLPALTSYLRFMLCTADFEHNINYKFKDKSLLRVALTHPSYMDTASYSVYIWNMLQNIGKQFPRVEKKKRKPHFFGSKKRGVLYMTNLMANLYQDQETKSKCRHNERLEFLGDAVLDYITSMHLFQIFPEKGPGKLTAFRSGIVQTEHLAELARKVSMQQFILVQHRVAELSKSEMYLGNAVEAIIGAIFLDSGIDAVDNFLSCLLFSDDLYLCKVWNISKKHPLQEEHPDSDRHMLEKSDVLKRFTKLEEQIGVEFKHIRILAKAFTHSIHGLADQSLTGGNYDRMEFFGDAILKYVSSDYLYRHFPGHQEGHLTLLRSSLVNAKCLGQAARELGLNNFIIFKSYKEMSFMKEKISSDIFEALLGALHVDKGFVKGILYCKKLIEVCILSRLKEFIINQEWLDPKSQLQQCCHSLRDPTNPMKEGKDYFQPVYKRELKKTEAGMFYYTVTVSVNGKKLGAGDARNSKDAEKEAAKDALINNYFEQYAQQKRIIYRRYGSMKKQKGEEDSSSDEEVSVPKRRFVSDDEASDEGQRNSDGERSRKGGDKERHKKTSEKESTNQRQRDEKNNSTSKRQHQHQQNEKIRNEKNSRSDDQRGDNRTQVNRHEIHRNENNRNEINRYTVNRNEINRNEIHRNLVNRDGLDRSMVSRNEIPRKPPVIHDDINRNEINRNRNLVNRNESNRNETNRNMINRYEKRDDINRKEKDRVERNTKDTDRSLAIRSEMNRSEVKRSDVNRIQVNRNEVHHNLVSRDDINRKEKDRVERITNNTDRSMTTRSEMNRSDVNRSDVNRIQVNRNETHHNLVSRDDIHRKEKDRVERITSDVNRSLATRSEMNRSEVKRSDLNRIQVNRNEIHNNLVSRDDIHRKEKDRVERITKDTNRSLAPRSEMNRSEVNRSDVNRIQINRNEIHHNPVSRDDIHRKEKDRLERITSDVNRSLAIRDELIRKESNRNETNRSDENRSQENHKEVNRDERRRKEMTHGENRRDEKSKSVKDRDDFWGGSKYDDTRDDFWGGEKKYDEKDELSYKEWCVQQRRGDGNDKAVQGSSRTNNSPSSRARSRSPHRRASPTSSNRSLSQSCHEANPVISNYSREQTREKTKEKTREKLKERSKEKLIEKSKERMKANTKEKSKDNSKEKSKDNRVPQVKEISFEQWLMEKHRAFDNPSATASNATSTHESLDFETISSPEVSVIENHHLETISSDDGDAAGTRVYELVNISSSDDDVPPPPPPPRKGTYDAPPVARQKPKVSLPSPQKALVPSRRKTKVVPSPRKRTIEAPRPSRQRTQPAPPLPQKRTIEAPPPPPPRCEDSPPPPPPPPRRSAASGTAREPSPPPPPPPPLCDYEKSLKKKMKKEKKKNREVAAAFHTELHHHTTELSDDLMKKLAKKNKKKEKKEKKKKRDKSSSSSRVPPGTTNPNIDDVSDDDSLCDVAIY